MKRILAMVLALCLVAVLIPMPASGAVYAQGQCGDRAYWKLDENGTLTIYGSGAADPYYPLPTWQNNNGLYTSKIKNVVIKSGITQIANRAFYKCMYITSVDIADTVTSIGQSAFYNCGLLTEIVLPSKLESLGGSAFAETGIQTITIPEKITTVSGGLFSGCDKLTSVTFQGAIKNIGSNAFRGCGKLETVNFEKGFSGEIQDSAFAGCESLKKFEIPEGITDIGEMAFQGCLGLTDITLPESLLYLSSNAFWQTSLVSITIPKSVKSMGSGVFSSCDQLKNITMYTETVEGLKGYVGGGPALEYIHIIGDAPKTEEPVINPRNELFVIYYDEGTSGWTPPTWNKLLIEIWGKEDTSKSGTCGENLTWLLQNGTLIISGTGTMDNFQSGDAPWYLYRNQIRNVYIEKRVESIGNNAFYNLDNLETVTIPGTVKTIGSESFSNCEQLKELDIPEGVVSIGYNAFWWCSALTKVTMADSVTSIGRDCFVECDSLTTVKLSEGLSEIPDSLFTNSGNLTSVNIPANVTKINNSAFASCYNLTELTLPDSVVLIGRDAFNNSGLKEFAVPAKVESIGNYAFSRCRQLQRVHFLGDAPAFEYLAFQNTIVVCIYPANNDTWTDAVMQDYGGSVTWIPDNHTHVYEAVYVEPTCTEQGYHGQCCFACGHVYAEEYVDPLGHDMAPATCINPSTCRRENCGYHEVSTVDHTWEDPCMTTRTCSICGFSDNGGGHFWEESSDMRYCFTCGKFEGGYLLDLSGMNESVWFGTAEYYSASSGDHRIVLFKNRDVGFMMSYTYNDTPSIDPHNKYPTGMKVWRLTLEGDRYTATRVEELDNILQYAGSSIRITGTKGIRMITSIEKSKKEALTGKGLAGYKLVEYGTALCWAKDVRDEKNMVLEKDFVKSNYAYKKGVADPIFAQTKDVVQYTNVLVGFTLDQCKEDIAMRPYMILEDADGTRFTIYGGIVYRSIGYIAYQNRHVFQPSTSAYHYVWEIVRKVYGSKYDAEYKR